jgi:hypothetical protein
MRSRAGRSPARTARQLVASRARERGIVAGADAGREREPRGARARRGAAARPRAPEGLKTVNGRPSSCAAADVGDEVAGVAHRRRPRRSAASTRRSRAMANGETSDAK